MIMLLKFKQHNQAKQTPKQNRIDHALAIAFFEFLPMSLALVPKKLQSLTKLPGNLIKSALAFIFWRQFMLAHNRN